MQTKELARRLGVKKTAIQAYAKRHNIIIEDTLTDDEVVHICTGYTKPNPNRSQETTQAAWAIINEVKGQEKDGGPAPQPTQASDTATKGKQRNRSFLYLVFVCMLLWQMHHVALLEHSVSPYLGKWGIGLAALFAFGMQFTGLLLTVYKANRNYLIMYLVLDFCINLLVYFPNAVLAKIMIAACGAIAIFSYAELFTNEHN